MALLPEAGPELDELVCRVMGRPNTPTGNYSTCLLAAGAAWEAFWTEERIRAIAPDHKGFRRPIIALLPAGQALAGIVDTLALEHGKTMPEAMARAIVEGARLLGMLPPHPEDVDDLDTGAAPWRAAA